MMEYMNSFLRGRGRGPLPWIALGIVGLAPLAGCDIDDILEVEDPFIVTTPVVQDTANLPAVHAGGIGEFARAFGGTQNREGGQVLLSALMTDESYHSGTFTTRREIDQRKIQETNSSLESAYIWLQSARNALEEGAQLFANSPRAGNAQHAELVNLAGFTYIFAGENFCSGVPFSRQPETGPTEFGSPLTTQQIFERAIERFDQAAQLAGNNATQANLARIGKARALLDLNRPADAAAVVATVPTNYLYNVTYSAGATRANNAVFQLLNGEKRFSAANNEGINGLPFRDVKDGRTPQSGPNESFSGTVRHFNQLKYTSLGSPIPLASGIEARLIEAEAALRAGNVAVFIAKLNEPRIAAGLAPLADPGSQQGRADLLFRERAFWFWFTSHRLGDLRRLIRQYNRTEDQVFPIGTTINGEPYGDDVAFPVPFSERNNPNFTGCLAPTTQA